MEPFVDLRTSQESNTSQGKKSWTKKAALVLAPMLMVGLAVGAGAHFASAAPSALVSIPNSVAPQVAAAKVLGSATGSQHMQIGVSLNSRNEAGLKDYATQIGQPKSKLYHQYLTPAQFALAFGPGAANLNAVEKFLQGQGLHLDHVASGGLFLQYSGTTAQVESAFHTHINNYRGADGRVFYANADAIQLPAAISPAVMDIAGTENARISNASADVAKRNAVHSNAVITCTAPTIAVNNSAQTALVASNLEKAYGITHAATNGAGVTVAYAEYDGYSAADLAAYQTACGGALPSKVTTTLAGIPAALTPGANALAVETELEVTMGLLPGVKSINVYEGANSSLGAQALLSQIANDNSAQVVGYSWGMCEADLGFSNAQAEEQIFMQMALQGQSVFASTGNKGLYACSGDGNIFRQHGFAVQDPASDPFVTAVGGSQLGLSTTSTWNGEGPWNDNVSAGSGGGMSIFWPAMSWQTSNDAVYASTNPNAVAAGIIAVKGAMNNASGAVAARVIPDVSAAADPTQNGFQVYCSVGSACTSGATATTSVGGTTMANAIWVSSAALSVQAVNASAPTIGGRLGLMSPALYTLYGTDVKNGTGVQDITLNAINYCDYANTVDLALAAITKFSVACATAGNNALNASVIFNGAADGHFAATNSVQYQQLGTSPYTTTTGYGISALNGANATTGYNALTGLGSPKLGGLSSAGTNLAGYLTNQALQGYARLYMVAQSTSANWGGTVPANTYWLASYTTNPYVQNLPTATAWYPLHTAAFTGAPAVIGDTAFGASNNLYIVGPQASGLGMLKFNLATQKATSVTITNNSLPGGLAGNSCANLSAFTDFGGNIGVYCVSTNGLLYLNSLTTLGVMGANWTPVTLSATPGATNLITYAPQVAWDGTKYLSIIELNNTASVSAVYDSFANLTANAGTTTANVEYNTITAQISTTCLSTPSVGYSKQANIFAVACIASDTHQMWANYFSTAKNKFNPTWSFLGQPSSSVNFMPGDSVGVDNISTDAANGQIMYVAEGSDHGMYLSEVNPTQTNYLGKVSGWMNVSLPGIFSSYGSTSFEGK